MAVDLGPRAERGLTKLWAQAEERARPGAARRHVPGAGRRVAARRGRLAQEGCRHRGQGPGQVRLLLGLQHGEYTCMLLPLLTHPFRLPNPSC